MPAKVGFLTVRRHEEHGYFGGYLVVNHLARPLEFHCTLPVKASRAQTVLYGPTIEDFICGEQIGRALIGRAKAVPELVVTDSPAVLAVSLVSEIAIVQIDPNSPRIDPGLRHENGSNSTTTSNLLLPMHSSMRVNPLDIGGHQFYLPSGAKSTHLVVDNVLRELDDRFDFCEPFGRIVEALAEAHPTAKAA